MPIARVRIGPEVVIGGPLPVIIAGPCVIESRNKLLRLAEQLAVKAAAAGLPLIFKASFDKANRTSLASYRGPGLDDGLAWLSQVRERTGLPVTTDVHEIGQMAAVAEAVDLIQIPAFLCRQTDLIIAAATCGRPVSIKKGQFLAPWDVDPLIDKFRQAGGHDLVLIERGASFGYNNLVADLRSLPIMRRRGVPVLFDATHSVQAPGGLGGASGGDGALAPALLRGALAVGCEGVFFETHPQPRRSPSDGPNMIPLRQVDQVLADIVALHQAIGRPPPPAGCR